MSQQNGAGVGGEGGGGGAGSVGSAELDKAVTLQKKMALVKRVMVEVEGVYIPIHYQTNRPMQEQIDRVRSLDLREDDVIICAFPRAGTHWTWEVTSMLLSRKAEHGSLTKEHSMLESTAIEDLQALPSPRLLNTHLPPTSFLPRQVKDKKIKVIHVYRNVKDVCMSSFHLASRLKGIKFLGTLEHFQYYFLSEMCYFGTYIGYLKSMDAFIKNNPEVPVFNVAYEDMRKSPEQSVQRLAEFLGVPPDPDLCTSIVEACSFQKLKHVDYSRERPQHLQTDHLYHKGKVGNWKNSFTVAQSERFDQALKQLQGCDFNFLYE